MATNDHGVSPKIGQNFRLGGCLISDKPSHFPKCGAAKSLSNTKLPPSVDLRIFMTPVENQGDSNSWLVSSQFFMRVQLYLRFRDSFEKLDILPTTDYYTSYSAEKDFYYIF